MIVLLKAKLLRFCQIKLLTKVFTTMSLSAERRGIDRIHAMGRAMFLNITILRGLYYETETTERYPRISQRAHA